MGWIAPDFGVIQSLNPSFASCLAYHCPGWSPEPGAHREYTDRLAVSSELRREKILSSGHGVQLLPQAQSSSNPLRETSQSLNLLSKCDCTKEPPPHVPYTGVDFLRRSQLSGSSPIPRQESQENGQRTLVSFVQPVSTDTILRVFLANTVEKMPCLPCLFCWQEKIPVPLNFQPDLHSWQSQRIGLAEHF